MTVNGRSELVAELKAWSASFETKQPQDVLVAAIERYGQKIVVACSFGAEDVVLVDMVHRINPSVPLFYLIPRCRCSISIPIFCFLKPMPRGIE
jgi:phosphoadenosine phosphosulfate reductase